jgi:hypothetical protein
MRAGGGYGFESAIEVLDKAIKKYSTFEQLSAERGYVYF